jgi:hypothetical protein
MSTITADPLHAQRMAALRRANEARDGQTQIKRLIKSGRMTIDDAFDDPRAQSMAVLDLLMSRPRWGRKSALKVLTRRFISESRKVRDLTERQRDELRAACR